MKYIIGLRELVTKYKKSLKVVAYLSVAAFDVVLAYLLYGPVEITELLAMINSNEEAKVEEIAKADMQAHAPTASATGNKPEAENKIGEDGSDQEDSVEQSDAESNEENSDEVSNSEDSESSTDNNGSTDTNPTPTPTVSTTPTPTPTATPTPTPTPTPTLTPTPEPNTETKSSVYITGYIYAGNQQLIAEQYPVKVFNSDNNEELFSGETGHDGKSPTWEIAAGTNISFYLYPKPGFNGCGDVWNLTIGNLGTMESASLSVVGERDPCITL